MKKKGLVKYWTDSADRDYQTVQHMFQTGDYHWSLFIGHLVLEKLFKALYVSRTGEHAPYIHDLVRLAEKSDLSLSEDMIAKLELISRFNLSVRYPDDQQEIYRICTREFSAKILGHIEEIRSWLLHQIPT